MAMELIRYLERHFFSREQLVEQSGITADELDTLQRRGMVPLPSYRLRLDIACDSFFGAHSEHAAIDYYARGYTAWIGEMLTLDGSAQARHAFAQRYRARLAQLAAAGITARERQLDDEAQVEAEWNAFLAGTYGLCTVSGLPEDIAAKEMAIAVIQEITGPLGERAPTDDERARLAAAVGLLDRASAAFAPHEVARSSRRRYVDTLREAFRL
jgi:hypothetical protein